MTKTSQLLTIGLVARQSGVRPHTLRFYERRGLLEPPRRRASGYREYTPDAVCLVRFIKRVQAMGFTLREVKVLLGALHDKKEMPRILGTLAAAKVTALRQRIEQLNEAMTNLLELVDWCQGGRGPVKGPIAEFFDALAHRSKA